MIFIKIDCKWSGLCLRWQMFFYHIREGSTDWTVFYSLLQQSLATWPSSKTSCLAKGRLWNQIQHQTKQTGNGPSRRPAQGSQKAHFLNMRSEMFMKLISDLQFRITPERNTHKTQNLLFFPTGSIKKPNLMKKIYFGRIDFFRKKKNHSTEKNLWACKTFIPSWKHL